MQRSNVTLEVFPTIQELAKTMLELLKDNGGHGDLYDAAKVLFNTNHEEIAKAFIYQAEDMNEKAMLAEGLCPECGDVLVDHHIPATREDPEENYPICSNTSCRERYTRKAS